MEIYDCILYSLKLDIEDEAVKVSLGYTERHPFPSQE